MYFAVLLYGLGSGPALGSWWSMLALLPVLTVFVRRTLVEDRLLRDELPRLEHDAHACRKPHAARRAARLRRVRAAGAVPSPPRSLLVFLVRLVRRGGRGRRF